MMTEAARGCRNGSIIVHSPRVWFKGLRGILISRRSINPASIQNADHGRHDPSGNDFPGYIYSAGSIRLIGRLRTMQAPI